MHNLQLKAAKSKQKPITGNSLVRKDPKKLKYCEHTLENTNNKITSRINTGKSLLGANLDKRSPNRQN